MMNLPKHIGSGLSAFQVKKNVEGFWDLSGPFPVPQKALICPVCKGTLFVKYCRYFKRPGNLSENPYRCDVQTKCSCCSAVQWFGLAVDKDKAESMGLNRSWTWREMLEYLGGRDAS